MEIKTERLVLSPVKEDDWRELKAIFDGLRPLPYAKYDKPHPTDDADIKARAARSAVEPGSSEKGGSPPTRAFTASFSASGSGCLAVCTMVRGILPMTRLLARSRFLKLSVFLISKTPVAQKI